MKKNIKKDFFGFIFLLFIFSTCQLIYDTSAMLDGVVIAMLSHYSHCWLLVIVANVTSGNSSCFFFFFSIKEKEFDRNMLNTYLYICKCVLLIAVWVVFVKERRRKKKRIFFRCGDNNWLMHLVNTYITSVLFLSPSYFSFFSFSSSSFPFFILPLFLSFF